MGRASPWTGASPGRIAAGLWLFTPNRYDRDSLRQPHGGVLVTGTDPSGTGTLIDDMVPTSTGAIAFGPADLHGILGALGLTAQANGCHLRASVSIDGVTTTSRPILLACGAPTHGGSALLMTCEVESDSNGAVTSQPPARLPADFVLEATSSMGTATCSDPVSGAPLTFGYLKTGTGGVPLNQPIVAMAAD